MSSHFEDKDALAHVVEKRIEGIVSLSESHGTETPGHISAGADSLRETALVLLLVWLFFPSAYALVAFGLGWFAWKTGRSAWLGWARLERLHRLIEQEKYEIEHHRPQEREELVALYRAKGFQGQLLDDVVDVLMADQDRLLNVMLEEEMGLTLQAYEHPIKQCLGAAIGAFISLALSIGLFLLLPNYGIPIAAIVLIAAGAGASAISDKNRVIPAIVWNLSIAALSFGIGYFIFQILI